MRRERISRRAFLGTTLVAGASLAVTPKLLKAADRKGEESLNMKLLGHHDLGGRDGAGKGGEGMAMATTADGRRIIYVAQESGPGCFSVIDVTDPKSPHLVKQFNVPTPDVRCNSLDLSGQLLVVAYEVRTPGLKPAGITLFDISDAANPVQIGFFDTSGPHSRGVHHVWFVDGRYAYIATGAADFVPTHRNDDEFLMIVDLSDPSYPTEVGRWWYPGTREGDPVPPPPRNPRFDTGYRLHNVDVHAERPDRAYLGYIDGGLVILDLSDPSRPEPLFVGHYDPPATVGFTHTVVPLFSRDLLVISSEAIRDLCEDAPKRIWTWDMGEETRPSPIMSMPDPGNISELCRRGGRFGAHNLWENRPGKLAFHTDRFALGSFFNGGVRLYDISDEDEPKEVAYHIPRAPADSPAGAIQINHIYWDELGIVYGVDRLAGGLYTFEIDREVLEKESSSRPAITPVALGRR